MTIQPLRDRVVFRHLERPETVLASGVILPADSQLAGSSVLAEVLAVGPGGKPKKSKKEEMRLLKRVEEAARDYTERGDRASLERLRARLKILGTFRGLPPSRSPVPVKPGDVILVQKHAGAPVDQSTWGDGARSLPEDGILAIVESPGVFHGGRFLRKEVTS